VKTKLSKLAGVSFKLGEYLSLPAAKSFYFAMIQSVLCYNIIFWGSSSKTILDAVQRKQNLIIRHLFLKHFNNTTSTAELYKKVEILNVHKLHRYSIAITLFQAVNEHKFPLIKDAIDQLQWNHDHHTRHIQPYRLPRARVLPDTNSYIFQSVKFFNSLPARVRNLERIATFKREVKHLLLRGTDHT
jgi:hypothetical protein